MLTVRLYWPATSWFAKEDCNYKSVKELIENLIDCRAYGCNFLLNTGLKGNGEVNGTDKCLLQEIGKWVKVNRGFIYTAKPTKVKAKNAIVLSDGEKYYAIIKNVGMNADPNVALSGNLTHVKFTKCIKSAKWLDSGEKITVNADNSFAVTPFEYGRSYSARVAEIEL